MSNKSRLQTNNTNLQALIDKANTLPDAGSGGSGGVNLETVTITYTGMPDPGSMVYYLDGTMTLQEIALAKDVSISVLKGSILITTDIGFGKFPSCTSIAGNGMCGAYLVTG